MNTTVEEIYARHIKNLTAGDKLRLMEIMVRDLAENDKNLNYSLLALEGLGAEIWQDVDPQTYVDGLRSE